MAMSTLRALLVLFMVVVVGEPAPAQASCSCMMRRRPPPSVTQQAGITRDPGYSPSAAVFMVRDGTRTVLTIEAAYDGPPVELSVVIPVPQSIGRSQVRTVTGTLFRNLDRRTAPTVRHVWPACRRRPRPRRARASSGGGGGAESAPTVEQIEEQYAIDIEDEWSVDEYDITLLGAEQSSGLLRYLNDEGLELPPRADEILRAYIEGDFRFVVAKVDPSRANRIGERMMLSPIQLEYDSDELSLPVRLGTLNSPGEQELLLYVLSKDGRYEIANRPNVTAPTDLRLDVRAAGGFAEVYASLMDETFRQTPNAVVTEFAHTLGRRVGRYHVQRFGIPSTRAAEAAEERGQRRGRWTLTRLRHRYGKDVDDDLTLRAAAAPLRLSRRWRHPELRTWAPRGQSAFHVQFVVEHRTRSCPSRAAQRRRARSWATAESLWEAAGRGWPGEALLDPVPALGIDARSAAPAGWPPPARVAEPPAPGEVVAGEGGEPPDAVPVPAAAPVPSPAAAPPSVDDGFFSCAASAGQRPPAVGLLLVLGLLLGRSRRR